MGSTVIDGFKPISTGARHNAIVALGPDLEPYTRGSEIRHETVGTPANTDFISGYPSTLDRVQVQVSLDGSTWVEVGAPILRYDAAHATPGWGEHVVALPAGYSVNGVDIGFLSIVQKWPGRSRGGAGVGIAGSRGGGSRDPMSPEASRFELDGIRWR